MQEVMNAVVIDNDIKDIIGVTTALAGIGISTLPVHYQDPTTAGDMCEKMAVASPRIIITDIQLRDGGAEPTKSDLSTVANCLGRIINATTGPYVILAWTSKPEALDELRTRVKEYFTKTDLRMPMYFDRICKNECRTEDEQYSAEKILEQFGKHLALETSVKALMHWECSVLQAAIESVNTLAEFDENTLPQSLKSLAISVAGNNLKGFEATAINEAFSYILKDKLALLGLEQDSQKVWEDVFSNTQGEIEESAKHNLNTILHIETSPQKNITCPGDVWISGQPCNLFKRITGTKEEKNQFERIKNEFLTLTENGHMLNRKIMATTDASEKKKLKDTYKQDCGEPLKNAKAACKIAMIEISPTCDFANKKRPLKTIALGVLIPVDRVKEEVQLKRSDSTIVVKIKLDGADHLLGFSAKYITAMSEKLISSEDLQLTKTLRVRESLLQSWIHRFSMYNSRIGTVSLN